MILAAMLSVAVAAAQPSPRPLAPGGAVRDTLAGGESVTWSFDVPAGAAARLVVAQDGIDVTLTLRRPARDTPVHGLDFVGGVEGDEVMYPPIADAPARWNVIVSATHPRAVRGDYTIALDLAPAGDRARAVAAARQRHYDASEISWRGGGAAHQEAAPVYAAAAAAALDAGDLEQAAESTYQCAREHDVLGDTPGALDLQLRALDLFRRAGRRDREARALNRLGDLSRKVGEVVESEGYFRDALPIARAVGDAQAVADILNNSGLLLIKVGRFEEAIEQLRSAIPLARDIDSANVEAALHNNIGVAYSSLGLFPEAIAAHERAVQVSGRLEPRRKGRALFLLAAAQFENGDRAAAEDTMRRSVEFYEHSADRAGMAAGLGLLGRMAHASGDDDRAVELFAQAEPILRELKNRLEHAQVLTAWAEVEVDRGRIDDALSRLDEAIGLARRSASAGAERQAMYVRAQALDQAGRVDEAIGSIAQAVDGVEAARGALQRPELRTSYLATVRKYFDLYIDLLQRKGSTKAALEVSERGRARTLLEGLAESGSKIAKGIDPELLARYRSVRSRLDAKVAYRAELAASQGDATPRALAADRDVDRLLEELAALRAAIRAASPLYSALQLPEPVRAAHLQDQLLEGGDVLVEYHLGERRSYAWVIDRASITAHVLPPAGNVDRLARRYHDLLSRDIAPLGAAARGRLAAQLRAAGRRLAAAVWTPLAARVGHAPVVVVVADGALQYVPFAALPGSGGAPLLARHEIVYLPSASVLDVIRRRGSRPVRPSATVAVFADPVFSRNDPRFGTARDKAAAAATRAADGGVYARLRFSRREAEAIASVSPGAFEALDFDAAKQSLAGRDLREYRILHFATHGALNTARPDLSGLVFSLVDRTRKPVDGFLRLHEIYNLDLDADLVVLSACRTALGKEVYGEGLIGLTRGFMYAGAARVVSSVWNVDDRASAQLMSRFYTEMLSKHRPPAAALRAAQLSMVREPRWSNPHDWAAFALQGDWR